MSEEKREQERSKFFSIKSFGKSLGPGVITGTAKIIIMAISVIAFLMLTWNQY